MRILIIDPSNICPLGSVQIKKLLAMLYAFKIADLEVRLTVNCKSMVIQLDMPYNDAKECCPYSFLRLNVSLVGCFL